MKKIIISVVAILVVMTAIFYLILKKNPKAETVAAPVATTATNDIPQLHLTQLDGTKLMSKDLKGKVAFVFFQPDCDHCQREAVQIREHINAFNDYQVYFVSDAELPQLRKFAQDYGLAESSNFYFAHIPTNDIFDTVGSIPTPSMYVFSEHGRLVNSFIGETAIEEILKYL
ncbi:TlpA family protein disulfide reductase [Pontibacter chitinilyticus]|uniref:TlpA family protein disulfide reductase n=1 Tax=Pontibacter chitinilyticus TaxID=2674989 RepID=UPI00321A5F7F